MKKFMLSAALIISAFTYVNAQSVTPATNAPKTETPAPAPVQDEWKVVQLDTLAPAVQTAIKAYQETCDIKMILFQESTKQTKVVLVSKADKKDQIVYLDEEGKEVKKV